MPISKKRAQIYAVGAAAKLIRGSLMTANFIAKTGITTGAFLSQLVIGSSIAMADELCGVRSPTHIGDDLSRGLCRALNGVSDWSSNFGQRQVTKIELWAKKKIMHSR